MVLSKEDIRFLLERLGEETIVEPSEEFPFRVSRKGFGYSKDSKVGSLQAKLSMMLEMAR